MGGHQAARQRAIVAAYVDGMAVDQLCATLDVTRSELAAAVNSAGVTRGMERPYTPEQDIADLYTVLYLQHVTIEQLRHEVSALRALCVEKGLLSD